jgi:hypothetical protein
MKRPGWHGRRVASWAAGLAFGAAALVLLGGSSGIVADELYCEEAVQHLVECCPGFPADVVDCTYASGCDPVDPELESNVALCIRRTPCEEVLARGMCDSSSWSRGCDGGPCRPWHPECP